MRSTWKRVLSALLTVAMIATLLVVPAVAATTQTVTKAYVADASDNDTNFFSASGGSVQSGRGTISYNNTELTKAIKMASGASVGFTVPAGATNIVVTVAYSVSKTDKYLLLKTPSNTSGIQMKHTAATEATTYSVSGEDAKVGDYSIARGNGDTYLFYVEVKYDVQAYSITGEATGDTNGSVTFTDSEGKAITAATAGTEVTVVAKGTGRYVPKTYTTNDTGTTVTEGKFTMPAKDIKVTVEFEEESLDGLFAAAREKLTEAVLNYTVAQADANTADDLKANVEAKLAEALNGTGVTAEVTQTSFTAATGSADADATEENNGSYGYSVTLKVGTETESGGEAITGTVTITATTKAYVRQDAKDALSSLRNEMKKYGAGATAADVFADKIVISEEQMKILTDAVALVAPADADKLEEAAYKKADTDAKAALAAFAEAIKDVDTSVKGTKTDAGLQVLTGDAGISANTYFTVTGAPPVTESGAGIFADGYQAGSADATGKRIAMTADSTIKFTVEEGKTADLRVYWVCNDNAKGITLAPAGGTAGGQASGVVKNTSAIATWAGLPAGTYTISGKQYIFRVEVKENGPAATDAPEFATNGDVCQMESKTDVTVMFKLNAEPATNTVFKLYDAETGGNQLGQNAGVTAGANNNITFTLQDSQKPTGTEDLTWYVTATAPDKAESERVAVTVKPYIPVTKVTLAHMGEGNMVDHVLYEKLKDTDEDVIGSQETNPSYANGWVLQAVVEPENATNKEVVFSNARETPEFIEVEEDGTVKAIKAGTGRIRVTSVGDPEQYAAVEITVKVRIGAVDIQKADGTEAPTTLAMGETLGLKAAVTASASASQSHQAVTWSSDDSAVATVSASGVVTPLKTGSVTITATSALDENIADTLTLTVTKGTPELKLTSGNSQVTSGGTVRFKLAGVPEGVTPIFTVKQGSTEVNDVEVKALENDENYNYYAVMPENATGSTVTYTVTAGVAADSNWNAAEASVDVGVLDENAKNILIKEPGTAKDVELVKGQTAELKVVAQVNGAGQVKDEAATAALTYAWTKDGEAMSDTTYTVTVDAAGEYICTVTSTDAAVETKTVTVTFTVTEVVPPMTAINVTADGGVDYTPATGALKITGPVAATFTVTTAPDGNEDTVTAVSSVPSVARVDLTDGKLTITPWSVGSTVITLKGTKATDVVKTINVTVVKAAAPAALTASDYTVTQPTAVGGKGTITITQNAPAGTEYVYRLGDSGAWIKFPASKSVELEPGVYKIRVYVPQPELQETTDGVAVEIKAATAAPSVDRVVVSSTASSVKVGGTVQMTAQVHMSNNTVSATEKVIWSTSDANVATVSATGLVTGVKAGVVTVTATSVTDSAKKGSKTLTVTEEQGVDKAALNAAITAAEGVYAIGDDVKVLPAGTKTGTVAKGQKFVTADKLEALEKAIADAKAVVADAKATQADVDKAVTALNAAKDAVKVLTGTKGSTSGRPSSRPSDRDPGNTEQPTNLPFTDVKADDWFYSSVKKAFDKGLMKGVEAERFAPSSNTTRAMVATVLFRMDGEKKTDVENLFNDVAADSWFTDAVAWAAGKGIVKGYDDVTFAPDDSVTREQLVAMLYRYAAVTEKSEKDLSAFTDAASVSEWAAEAMTWAVDKGIILGRGNGQLDPQGLATRAEVCAVLVRFLEMK